MTFFVPVVRLLQVSERVLIAECEPRSSSPEIARCCERREAEKKSFGHEEFCTDAAPCEKVFGVLLGDFLEEKQPCCSSRDQANRNDLPESEPTYICGLSNSSGLSDNRLPQQLWLLLREPLT